ncbi:MAG: sulfite exporter TauE/SafE family protein [Deltaproteobacteria bacterium]|nr:MAG: sulfite exporter TauE/SafE family protein [Deltaproteobacteria bacterium]
MLVPLVAGLVTLLFTTLLTIAGVGAAFILIPVFIALGVDVHVAMSTALLLNAIAMAFASYRFVRAKLVLWDIAVPTLLVAAATSPLGAMVGVGLDRETLLWGFVGFLLFAAAMMLFYRPKERPGTHSRGQRLGYGLAVGAFAGFLGGMLGVGGGNFVVPVLVWLGISAKQASATTSFIVIFASLSGFLGRVSMSGVSPELLAFTGVGAAAGAVLGAWLMTEKLNRNQVKLLIGVVLLGVAAKMTVSLVA